MDWVDKFEGRTVWDGAGGLKGKWGSTEVVLRGRPAGELRGVVLRSRSWIGTDGTLGGSCDCWRWCW